MGRRDELEVATRFDHLPSTLMDLPVVVVAEQDKVFQLVRPASRAVDDVVRVRPVDLAVAAGEPAALVASPQRPAHRRRDGARRPPDVITIESASRTRDMVQSQVMRTSVRVEMGSESSRSAGGAPSSFFKPSIVVVTLT